MKILYVYKALAIWGGIERVLIDKINYLANFGYSVYVITADQGEHIIPYHLDNRVNYEDLKIMSHKQYEYPLIRRILEKIHLSILFKKRLKQRINSINPDIIICVTEYYVDVILGITKGKIPVIAENHSNYKYTKHLNKQNPIKLILRKRYMHSLKKASVIVSLTQKDTMDWKKKYGHVVTIPNVVHLNPNANTSSYENHRVIFVGRLAAQKGWKDLIKIWKIIHRKYQDWELDYYGDGEDKNDFLSIINKYQDHIGIVYHEPVHDIFSKYCESSIFIMTSVYEPFGLVLPEAMSCGLPVVAFDCNYGPREIITDGTNGFLIYNRNIDEFVYRLSCLIENEPLRKQLGQNAITSSQQFSKDIVMSKWIDLFNELAN